MNLIPFVWGKILYCGLGDVIIFYGQVEDAFILSPQPPSDAVRKQKKIVLEDLFSLVMSQFKKYHLSGNLEIFYLGKSHSSKLCAF